MFAAALTFDADAPLVASNDPKHGHAAWPNENRFIDSASKYQHTFPPACVEVFMVPSECGGLREKRFRQSAALLAKGGIRLFWLPGFLILALWCPRTAVYKVCLKEQAKGKGHLSLPGANLETTCQKMPLVSRKRGVRDQSLPGAPQKSYPRPGQDQFPLASEEAEWAA